MESPFVHSLFLVIGLFAASSHQQIPPLQSGQQRPTDAFSVKCCQSGKDFGHSPINCEAGYVKQPSVDEQWNNYCPDSSITAVVKPDPRISATKGTDVAKIGGDCKLMPVVTTQDSHYMQQCCTACSAGLDAIDSSCNIHLFSIIDQAYVHAVKIIQKVLNLISMTSTTNLLQMKSGTSPDLKPLSFLRLLSNEWQQIKQSIQQMVK